MVPSFGGGHFGFLSARNMYALRRVECEGVGLGVGRSADIYLSFASVVVWPAGETIFWE
jgi:hypothetical protein